MYYVGKERKDVKEKEVKNLGLQ